MKRQANLTTVEKVEQFFQQEKKPVTATYLAVESGLHYDSVKSAIQFLLSHKIIRYLPASNKGKLYELEKR